MNVCRIATPLVLAVVLSLSSFVPAALAAKDDVNVVNTPATAVPTKDQYSIVLGTPVNFKDTFSMASNIFGGESNFYHVPLGKRLIITYVSMQCDLPGSADGIGLISSDQDLETGTGSTYLGVFVPMRSVPSPATGAGHVMSVGGTPTQLVFDPGKAVQLDVNRTNGTDTAFCFVGFAGYLVPVP